MAETLSSEMNTKKVIVDNSTAGVTYIGLAYYPRPGVSNDRGYRSTADESIAMWKIKKIVESGGITETFYPEGNYSASYKRSERTSLQYI